MRWWMILGIIVLILWLISLIRLGALVDYSADGLVVKLRVGPFSPTVFPMKKKEKPPKEKKPKKPKEPAPEGEKKPKKGGALSLVKRFLPLVAEAAGRLKRKIRIDRLDLDLVLGGDDPAAAAMAYGGVNMALGIFGALFEQNFRVKERSFRTAVDFTAPSAAVTILAAATLTIGQLLAMGLILGVKALVIFLRYRKETSIQQKEAI